MAKTKKVSHTDIDKLGHIKLILKDLKTKEADLVKLIKEAMEDGEVIETNDFIAKIIVKQNRIIDQAEVRSRIGQKKFLELAKIGVEDLKKVMGADEIDACTVGFNPVRTLDVDPIKKEEVVGAPLFDEGETPGIFTFPNNK